MPKSGESTKMPTAATASGPNEATMMRSAEANSTIKMPSNPEGTATRKYFFPYAPSMVFLPLRSHAISFYFYKI